MLWLTDDRPQRWWWWWWWEITGTKFFFRHWPHVHRDTPAWPNNGFPYLRQNYRSVLSDKVIMPFRNMWSKDIDMEKRLLDKLFYTLYLKVSSVALGARLPTYIPSVTRLERKRKFSSHCVLKRDRFLISSFLGRH
jgi:hypothetical protein